MKKLAVIFPGIGYTAEKPLLYYAGKLAKEHGYETVNVAYSGFPEKVKGDRAKMEESFRIVMKASKKMLKELYQMDDNFTKEIETSIRKR